MVKTIDELEQNACLYWPKHLNEVAEKVSTIPLLLKTQDQFLSILKSSDKNPDSWAKTLENASSLPANVFLKHLTVLSDFGGERLQRISKDFDVLFPSEKVKFIWNDEEYFYKFEKGKKSWTNSKLKIDKAHLFTESLLTKEMYDVAMFILWGSSIIDNPNIPPEVSEKCIFGTLLGKTEELEEFVKQRYIQVSRITGGSTANDLGHALEYYLTEKLSSHLGSDYEIGGHNIPDISHNDKDLTTFDIVVKSLLDDSYTAIEVSFQVTTNSTIERKAGQAQSRKEMLNAKGHKVAYVVDGSGNFQRKNAISTIINFSDITVNFSDSGILELVDFIKNGQND